MDKITVNTLKQKITMFSGFTTRGFKYRRPSPKTKIENNVLYVFLPRTWSKIRGNRLEKNSQKNIIHYTS